jgi:hypothetical protein
MSFQLVISDLDDPIQKGRWDSYVLKHPTATPAFLSSYRELLLSAYGLKTLDLVLIDTHEAIVGILRFVVISGLFRKTLYSLPYFDFGGALLSNEYNDQGSYMASELTMLLEKNKASSIHIKGGRFNLFEDARFVKMPDAQTAVLDLCPPSELFGRFDRAIGKNIKRAEQAGLVCRREESEEYIRNIFYPRYELRMKELGTPPHSLKFFLEMRRSFSERFLLFVVSDQKEDKSLLLGLSCAETVQILYLLSQPDTERTRHSDYAHWKMIEWAALAGFKRFEFGMARYEGQIAFKKKWATRFEDYFHYFLFRKSQTSRPELFNENVFFQKVWSKYMPLFLARYFGPYLRKRMGR